MSREAAALETRAYGRSASLLTVAVGFAGVMTYVFFALLSHTLPADDYGAVVVLWSAVYIASSTFFRPIEQLLARALAELEEGSAEAQRRVLSIAAKVQLGLLAAVLAAGLALRGPIESELLESDRAIYVLLLVALAGFAGTFFARGLVAGKRNARGYAALLVLEAGVRILFALAIAVGLSDDPVVAAAAVAAAPILALSVLPLALRRWSRGGPAPGAAPGLEPEFTLSQGGAFAASVLVVMLSEQVIVNSGVLFVRAEDGAAAAGMIFNVLMLVRAPLVLFLAVAASLLPHLSRLRARGAPGDREAFAGAVRQTLRVVAVFAVVAVVVVLAAGPSLMEIAFGDAYDYERDGLLSVALGLGFYLGAATLSQAVLAQGKARWAALCWGLAAGAFVVWNLVGGLDAAMRVEVGFAVTAVGLFALLYGAYRRPDPHALEIEPGSGRDVEIQLATADDVA